MKKQETSKEVLMTEKQFIAKFKKAGFELYETKSLKPKLLLYNKVRDLFIKSKS